MTETTAAPLPSLIPEAAVILLNDDETPFDFVCNILVGILERTPAEAEDIAMLVDQQGQAVGGVFDAFDAMDRAERIHAAAANEGYPFRVRVEPVCA